MVVIGFAFVGGGCARGRVGGSSSRKGVATYEVVLTVLAVEVGLVVAEYAWVAVSGLRLCLI